MFSVNSYMKDVAELSLCNLVNLVVHQESIAWMAKLYRTEFWQES